MKILNLLFITMLCSSCATQRSAEKAAVYARPSSFIAAQVILDKSNASEHDVAKLKKVSESLLALSQNITGDITREEMIEIVVGNEPSNGKWVVFGSYIYDIYFSKISTDKVKNTSLVITEIAKGVLDAVSLRTFASK